MSESGTKGARSDGKDGASGSHDEPKALTRAQAARLVRREVPAEDKDGNPTTKEVAVRESEVLDFKEYADRVVVVTVDGRKLVGSK